MAEAEEEQVASQSFDSNGDAPQDDAKRLKELIAVATLKYSIKDYDAAAESYAFATELQAEMNGEMSPENADLLYAYGRCLYHVAVKKSDVLGTKVAGETKNGGSKASSKKEKKPQTEIIPEEGADDGEAKAVEQVAETIAKEGEKSADTSSKPYFQFTGDENFDASEDDLDDGEQVDGNAEAEEDDEDDFVVAFEVLDLARVLLQKKIAETEANLGKGKEYGEAPEVRRLKERLADTYDLQAEISLEDEKFPSAVVDLKSSLELKKELYPEDSSLIAEAHFKLSLALEFSSVTQQKDENGEVKPDTIAQVDEGMREEAAQELEAAIRSCKSRIVKEEARLKEASSSAQSNGDGEKPKVTKAEIDDVKEMVKDLQQRVRQAHIDLQLHSIS